MDYLLKSIPGLRPLTPQEMVMVQEFEKHMEEVVIPQIVEQEFRNREAVAKARDWFID